MVKEQHMLLFIADISGYTSYMLKNEMEFEHAQLSLSILLESLIKQMELPFEISKLEGDAVFLYLQGSVKDKLWLSKKIFSFFNIFEKKVLELQQSNVCNCGGCQNIEKLQLKVIAHYGKVSIQKIGTFRELSGVDVIILHRLLKNHVPSHRYFLLTEAAYQEMLLPESAVVSKMEEKYEDVGTIPVYVCEPPPVADEDLPHCNTKLYKLKRWLEMQFGSPRKREYNNLP